MTAGQWPARATLKLHWPGGPVVIAWPESTSAGPGQARCVTPTAKGELLIAGAYGADPFLPEIADVICCPAAPADLPDQVLRRYPGCAVAAVPGGGRRCRVVTRTGYRFTITVAGLAVSDARATALGASFVYCWMAAGLSAALLESAELTASACESSMRWSGAEDDAMPSVPFDISF